MGMDPLSVGVGAANLIGQRNLASAQAKQQKTRDALVLAERRRDQQSALEKTLASQNAGFAARGVDPASGSALGLARGAESRTARDLALIDADAAFREQSRESALSSSLLNFGQSGVGLAGRVGTLWGRWR